MPSRQRCQVAVRSIAPTPCATVAVGASTAQARGRKLIAYGPDLRNLFRRAGAMARKIVDVAVGGGSPVKQPVRLDLNLRAAGAPGREFPPLLPARADEVPE